MTAGAKRGPGEGRRDVWGSPESTGVSAIGKLCSIGRFFWCCGIGFGGGRLENLLTSNATAPKKTQNRAYRPESHVGVGPGSSGARELGAGELGSWGAGRSGAGNWELESWKLGSRGTCKPEAGELGAAELGAGELESWEYSGTVSELRCVGATLGAPRPNVAFRNSI